VERNAPSAWGVGGAAAAPEGLEIGYVLGLSSFRSASYTSHSKTLRRPTRPPLPTCKLAIRERRSCRPPCSMQRGKVAKGHDVGGRVGRPSWFKAPGTGAMNVTYRIYRLSTASKSSWRPETFGVTSPFSSMYFSSVSKFALPSVICKPIPLSHEA